MTTLYVQERGTVIRRTGRRLLVCKGKEVLQSVRLRELDRVAVFGNVELSASAIAVLLEEGIETAFLSPGGKFRGRLAPAEGKNVFLRQAQFRAYDDVDLRVRTARAILMVKIRNARYVLQRHHQNHPTPALAATIQHLERSLPRMEAQLAVENMLGVEGDAARVYFGAFGGMVRQEFAFTVRSRRPPRDPVNALLSFGYTLLTTELTGAVAAHGLDPHIGMLHELDYGRPSLALDILEEFRQPVIDRLVLSLVNRRVLRAEHFEDRAERGVLLSEDGRPRFLEYYHRTLETEFRDPGGAETVTYRKLLQRQARRMRALIQAGHQYRPFMARGGESLSAGSASVGGLDGAPPEIKDTGLEAGRDAETSETEPEDPVYPGV